MAMRFTDYAGDTAKFEKSPEGIRITMNTNYRPVLLTWAAVEELYAALGKALPRPATMYGTRVEGSL